MFKKNSIPSVSKTQNMPIATASNDNRLANEQKYHKSVRKLYKQTSNYVIKLQKQQLRSQNMAVVSMTRALNQLVVQTTEMMGFLIGTMMSGGEVAGKSMFANFLDMLGQFCVMLGTAAVAASQVFEALFSGNPVALLVGGLAMIAVGGIVKAFASQLKSQGSSLGSASGFSGSVPLGSGSATGSGSMSPMGGGESQSSGQTVYYYHFEGGLYDERGLARLTTKAINDYAGRSAPMLNRRVVEGL